MAAAASTSYQKITALLDAASSAASARMAVEQGLADKHLFFFGDIITHPAVKTLSESADAGWAKILHIFAFGTLEDYISSSERLPKLSSRQLLKLKQLSLMAMAASTSVLPFKHVATKLQLSSNKEVEHLTISCVDAGLLEAKLNLKAEAVEVRSVRGRDLAPEDVKTALERLDKWQASIQKTIAALEQESEVASTAFRGGLEHGAVVSKDMAEAVAHMEAERMHAPGGREGRAGERHHGASVGQGLMDILGGLGASLAMRPPASGRKPGGGKRR